MNNHAERIVPVRYYCGHAVLRPASADIAARHAQCPACTALAAQQQAVSEWRGKHEGIQFVVTHTCGHEDVWDARLFDTVSLHECAACATFKTDHPATVQKRTQELAKMAREVAAFRASQDHADQEVQAVVASIRGTHHG